MREIQMVELRRQQKRSGFYMYVYTEQRSGFVGYQVG